MNLNTEHRNRRPEILFLAHRFPYPPDRGDRIRSWNILRYLSQRANVSLACTTDTPIQKEQMNVVRSMCDRVLIAPLDRRMRWFHAGNHWLAGRSLTEGLFWSRKFAHTLDYWADVTRFDQVFVYCSSMLPYARRKSLRSLPRVVDLVDVDSQKWKDYAENSNWIRRQVYHSEARRISRLEKLSASESNAVLLASEAEAVLLRGQVNRGKSSILGVSNGVDSVYFDSQAPPPDLRGSCQPNQPDPAALRLIFVGVLDYLPNIEGLRWFLKNVWHPLRQLVPNLTLDIVGKNPGLEISKFAEQPGVSLVGAVEDVRPFIAAADVVIAPLKIARGIQNKVLEAMSMAKPLVLTTLAAQGIDAVSDKHYIVADTAEDWVENLAELARCPEARHQMGEVAREFVELEFNWNTCLAPLDRLLGIYSTANKSEQLAMQEV
ncbi:MAG: TIGR03087 family PEP-CTERM/XrtA system glycosyltransferase [Planctomycetota bacterium]|nr:TIGR03087 family PEP-CTERM/XrtA system glycosyltransferase [Planctomycetota bacterium]